MHAQLQTPPIHNRLYVDSYKFIQSTNSKYLQLNGIFFVYFYIINLELQLPITVEICYFACYLLQF